MPLLAARSHDLIRPLTAHSGKLVPYFMIMMIYDLLLLFNFILLTKEEEEEEEEEQSVDEPAMSITFNASAVQLWANRLHHLPQW